MLPPEARQHLARWFTPEELGWFRYTQRGPLSWLFRRVFKRGAVTWNRVVNFALSPYDPHTPSGLSLIGHELYHVVDQRRTGWWRYLARYVWLSLRGGYWGRSNANHPMEVPAYTLGAEVEQTLREGVIEG